MAAIRLTCAVNNYHWGKHGLDSKAAQFAATNPDVTIDSSQTYAELWMGTHPSGPSNVYGTDTPLSAIVEECPEQALGAKVAGKYGATIPFLFKVLSIEKALSIQAHPDKALAERLHAERPTVYKDPNHKPEMSIALTDFIAMSGFRPLEEIAQFLDEYPEFRALVSQSSGPFLDALKGGSDVDAKKAVLKALFSELMNAPDAAVKEQLSLLLARVGQSDTGDELSPNALVQRLADEYPGDVGVFCVFVLNVLSLRPGDAFFMGPNDPHAYISGDCVECMATSDNVVRAGLTPKLRDVPVLVDMLTYEFGTPEAKLLKPVPFAGAKHSVVYDPPIDEFSVVKTALSDGQKEEIAVEGPQILIVSEGTGTLVDSEESHPLAPGYVYFIVANSSVVIETSEGSQLVAYTATCLP
ncbi:Mannose-6-phosphate isomerase [Coemansia interrupta]|uniref:Mannose-6-phosphate isomerase n=1 Tax=Coemansia interrupta TaxID=1126814 RepID=A0A9W8LIW4_9FUNG|nr:Mannose-6-phosphate isomerase [Coemansia interrupta]